MVNGFWAIVESITPSLTQLRVSGSASIATTSLSLASARLSASATPSPAEASRQTNALTVSAPFRARYSVALSIATPESPCISKTSTILIPGWSARYVFIPLQALCDVQLAVDGEKRHIALPIQLLHQPLAAEPARLQVIGADEVKPLALGSVRVDGDDRDSRRKRLVDLRLHQLRIRRRDQHPGRFPGDHGIELVRLSLGIQAVRPAHLRPHPVQ